MSVVILIDVKVMEEFIKKKQKTTKVLPSWIEWGCGSEESILRHWCWLNWICYIDKHTFS